MKPINLTLCALLALPAALLPLSAQATPKPATMPKPSMPNRPLHGMLEVEVNAHGQVVRVVHGTLTGDPQFDTMMIGNALQMWIRHPNGTAQVGLYRVLYDYDAKTHNVLRFQSLLRAGGNWANEPGAATSIIRDAKRQEQAVEKQLKAQAAKRRAQQERNLPSIHRALKRAMASPAPKPTH